MYIYEVIKQSDFESFCSEYENRGFSWMVKETAQMVNRASYLKVDVTGIYSVYKPNYAVPVMWLLSKDKKYLEVYFRKVIQVSENEKKKKVKRLSEEQIDDIERKYFKALIKNDTAVSLRYGMELFERDYGRFIRASITFALMTGWEKVMYVTSMNRLMYNNFDKDTKREIAVVTIKFIAAYVNRLDNYEKEYIVYNEEVGKNTALEKVKKEMENIKESGNKSDTDYALLIYLDGIKLYDETGGEGTEIFYGVSKKIENIQCDDVVKEYAAEICC